MSARPSRLTTPGPALVLAAVGLVLVGLGAASSPTVALIGELPPVSPESLVGLLVVLAVLLVVVVTPRVDDASRVLVSSSCLGGLGLAVAVLSGADGRPGSLSQVQGSELLGLTPGALALLTSVSAPVVIDLALIVAARRCAASMPVALATGATVGLVALVGTAVTAVVPGPALATVAAGAAALLIGVSLWRGTPVLPGSSPVPPPGQGPPEGVNPPAQGPAESVTRGVLRRTDLLLAAVLCLASLVAATATTGAGAALVAVLALLAVAERLSRWRALGQLEVLARSLGATALVCVVTGSLVVAAVGPAAGARGWRVTLTVVALLGLVVAALLPRPPAPVYARPTHLRVVRGLPWGLAAALLAMVPVVLPEPADAPSGLAVDAASAPLPAPTVPPASTPSVANALPTGAGSPSSLTAGPASPSATGLSIRLGPTQGTKVDLVLTASRTTGPLEIRTRIGADDVSYPLVTVPADRDLTVVVILPERGRFLVTLNDLTHPAPLRTLVVERR